ncbi:Lsa36 family surface (lipo)protein [Breznakiellaceae bacterium SP9]
MNRNKALHAALAAVLFLAGVIGASADERLQINGTAPSTGTSADPDIRAAWNNSVMTQLKNEMRGIDAKPEKLIRAFGDASAFSSHAGTQRGYGQLDRFGFSLGFMGGARMGTNIANAAHIADTLQEDLKRDHDLALGLGIGFSAQISFNASFLLPGLSLGVKFGGFNTERLGSFGDKLISNLGFKTQSAGITASYQLVNERTLVPFLLKWRGITAGSGVFYQKTDLTYTMEINTLTGMSGSVPVYFDPRLLFSMTAETTTIPLEITTAIQLFSFLNITLGGGADFAFGTNNLKLSAETDVRVGNVKGSGNLSVTGGGEMNPTYCNPKLITGVGFKMGPVVLDVPVTLYLAEETGMSVGVTVGILW